MNINEFSEKILEEVKRISPDEFSGAVVKVIPMDKNNDFGFMGMTLQDSGVAAAVYNLDKAFEQFKNGSVSINELADDIWQFFRSNSTSISTEWLYNFEEVKDRIIFRLVNAKNHELLQYMPHRLINSELALIYYVYMSGDDTEHRQIRVNKLLLEQWGVTEQLLYETAMVNTPVLFPVRQFFIVDALLCTTNKDLWFGAGVILYPEVFKALEKEEDVVLIPSSVNEMLVIRKNGMSYDIFNQMVREVNETQLRPSEILAECAFRIENGAIVPCKD